jgi:hypothetical protein
MLHEVGAARDCAVRSSLLMPSTDGQYEPVHGHMLSKRWPSH